MPVSPPTLLVPERQERACLFTAVSPLLHRAGRPLEGSQRKKLVLFSSEVFKSGCSTKELLDEGSGSWPGDLRGGAGTAG